MPFSRRTHNVLEELYGRSTLSRNVFRLATIALGKHDYAFAKGSVYNLLADDAIKNHGDVRGQRVAYAILSAAAAI